MPAINLDSVWERILESVSQKAGRSNIKPLFSQTKITHIHDSKVFISVPNRFLGDMVCDQYYDFFSESLGRELGVKDIQIQCDITDSKIKKESKEDGVYPKTVERKNSGLNASYTFSSFVIGPGNQFAHAASRRVAESPGNTYNPLFIYGDVGLGKTHLLSCIGNFTSGHPEKKIVYVTCEQFMNDFINSIRYEKMAEFRKRYRSVDLLLIDDIQFISGKEGTQEEFFHTFNSLYEENKQIVFTSDRSVKELADIEERLRSRFEMGLVADIQPPDLETKIAILYKKAESEGIVVPKDVAILVASHTRSNVRELEGALIRLGAYSSLMREEITVPFARNVLKDIIVEAKKEIYIEDVQKAVLEKFQIKESELKSKRRTKNLIMPRQIGMYLCRELTKASFPEIGAAFGGKDHSTVIYSCKQVDKDRESDSSIKKIIAELSEKLKGEQR